MSGSISVIIVSWNAKRYLLQCLESLYDCPLEHLKEVIVIDNASSDSSADEVSVKFPQVRLIRNAVNLGFSTANNMGIRASSGEYVCLINSDIKLLGSCLQRLRTYAEAHPEIGMIGPRILEGDGRVQPSCRGFPKLWNMFCRALALDALLPRWGVFNGYLLRHWRQDEAREVDILSGCFWFVRRQALQKVGLLDEEFFMYGEDMDWCKRFWKSGWKLKFLPTAEAIHYGGKSSTNAPIRFYIEKQRADLQYWRKHHGKLGMFAYFAISFIHHLLRVIGYCLVSPARKLNSASRLKVTRSLRCLAWMMNGAFTGLTK